MSETNGSHEGGARQRMTNQPNEAKPAPSLSLSEAERELRDAIKVKWPHTLIAHVDGLVGLVAETFGRVEAKYEAQLTECCKALECSTTAVAPEQSNVSREDFEKLVKETKPTEVEKLLTDRIGDLELNLYRARTAAECHKRSRAFMSDDRDAWKQKAEASTAELATLRQEVERLKKSIADDRPNGRWLDRFGACRVCEGEIPHGHAADCDHYKLEKEIKSLTAEIERSMRYLRDLFATYAPQCTPLPSLDGLISQIDNCMAGMRDSPPEVIEGRGQVAPKPGIYSYCDDNGNVFASTWEDHEILQHGVRYIYVAPFPTFPPRATFKAPPKPEMVLVRMTSPILGRMHEPFWGYKQGDYYCDVANGTQVGTHNAEVIDETTGEPIKE